MQALVKFYRRNPTLVLRWVVIVLVVGGALALALPPEEKIRLGLDLKGGSFIQLGVKSEEAVRAQTDQLVDALRGFLEGEGIAFTDVVAEGLQTIRVTGPDAARWEDFKGETGRLAPDWDPDERADAWELALPDSARARIEDEAVGQALETIRNRIDEFGVAEPEIQRQGLQGQRIVLQLPGVDTTSRERIKSILITTAFLEWRALILPDGVDHGAFIQNLPTSEAGVRSRFPEGLPSDVEVLPYPSEVRSGGQEQGVTYYVPVRKAPILTGLDLQTARSTLDSQWGDIAISFTLKGKAGQKFGKFTGANVDKGLVIVLDKKVQSVATIRNRITTDGILTGSYTQEEADDLALKLRAGSLPAGVEFLEERSVGPSLGLDSIKQGLIASGIGFGLVVLFMLGYYRRSGINAVVALTGNIVLLLGVMAYLKAVLTLPGIAGFILTIGMAVDANILIFERIKEDLALQRTVKASITNGFAKAFTAIFDSNITTLIAALFLFQFGTGPVRGFAVTLSVGLLANMFTAVFLSRTIFLSTILRREQVEALSI